MSVAEDALNAFGSNPDVEAVFKAIGEASRDQDDLLNQGDLGFGVGRDMVSSGKRIFNAIEVQLHSVLCGESKEAVKDRESIEAAMGVDDATGVAAISYAIMHFCGAAPNVAMISAVLLLKLVFKPAGKVLCSSWDQRLKR